MKSFYLIFFTFLCVIQSNAQYEECNCCSENHKAFDFWMGHWEVINPDGSVAGTNTIVKSLNNCILQENWTSAKAGYTGTSTNFYNQITNQWEQLWIDNTGAHLKLNGNRRGNQMILSSDEYRNREGVQTKNRITWTINMDGTVRQLWEVLQDNKVISVAFDGLYKRVE